MKATRLSRRGFLHMSALALTGGVLAGCGPAPTPQIVKETVQVAVKETVIVPATAEPVQKREPFILNHMARHDFESQRLAVKAWNDSHPDVTIKMDEVVGDTWDYYRIKMMQELAAGNPPDTVFTDVWYFRIYAIDGVFMNLEPLIEKDGQFKKQDLWEVCVTNCSSPDINGDMYCLPYDYGTHALAYNKKIFDEAEIPYPDKNKEYEWEKDILPLALELTRDLNGKKTTEAGFDPRRIDRYGVNPYTYLYWWYITQAGGQCFDASFTKSTMNSPEAVEGIQFLYDLQNKYYVSPSPAYQQSQPIGFQTGKIAMSIVATWDIPMWMPTIDFDWDIVRPPRRKVKIGDGRVSGQAILSATKHVEEAWQWIKYLSIGLGQEFKQITAGAIHPVKSKARNDTFMQRTKAPYNMEAFIQEAELGGGPPLFRYWAEYNDMCSAELTRAYADEVKVKEALDTCVQKTEYLLANGKLP